MSSWQAVWQQKNNLMLTILLTAAESGGRIWKKIDYRKMGMEIKIRRLRADISQSDLAKQIGVSQSHLCNVENGRLSPSLRLLLSLRKLLGCTIDELLIGADTESKGKE